MDYVFDAPPIDRELLDFAVRLVSRAGQMSVKGFFGDWHSRRKEDGSEVTEVDEAVEELIRAELASIFRDGLPTELVDRFALCA